MHVLDQDSNAVQNLSFVFLCWFKRYALFGQFSMIFLISNTADPRLAAMM